MKILVISGALPPMRAGEADHTWHLCRHLADRGLDVHLLTTRTYRRADDRGGSSLPFVIHPVLRDWSWRSLPRLAAFIRRSAPDAILLIYTSWIYHDHPMITFAPTIAGIVLPGVPFVTQVEAVPDQIHFPPTRPARAVRKLMAYLIGRRSVDYYYGTLLRDSRRLIVLADDFRATLAKSLPAVNDKCVVIPPPPIMWMAPEDGGETRRRGRARLGAGPGDFLLIYFGYIHEGKGVETLLRALQVVVNGGHHHVRLVLVGGGSRGASSYVSEMHDLARRLGIEGNVTWTGEYASESDEASVYMRAADGCVLPFDKGIFMNNSSFAAAVSHRLPVVTTRGEKLEPPFVDGRNVLLCPPKDPPALAGAITTLITSPALRRELSRGAEEMAAAWFSWDTAVSRTIETFDATA